MPTQATPFCWRCEALADLDPIDCMWLLAALQWSDETAMYSYWNLDTLKQSASPFGCMLLLTARCWSEKNAIFRLLEWHWKH